MKKIEIHVHRKTRDTSLNWEGNGRPHPSTRQESGAVTVDSDESVERYMRGVQRTKVGMQKASAAKNMIAHSSYRKANEMFEEAVKLAKEGNRSSAIRVALLAGESEAYANTRAGYNDSAKDATTPEKKIEAYGVKGMKSTPWRKIFKNQAEFEKWIDKNDGDYQVMGTRTIDATSFGLASLTRAKFDQLVREGVLEPQTDISRSGTVEVIVYKENGSKQRKTITVRDAAPCTCGGHK